MIKWVHFDLEVGMSDGSDLVRVIQEGINVQKEYPDKEIKVIDFSSRGDELCSLPDSYIDDRPYFAAIVIDEDESDLEASFKENFSSLLYTEDDE